MVTAATQQTTAQLKALENQKNADANAILLSPEYKAASAAQAQAAAASSAADKALRAALANPNSTTQEIKEATALSKSTQATYSQSIAATSVFVERAAEARGDKAEAQVYADAATQVNAVQTGSPAPTVAETSRVAAATGAAVTAQPLGNPPAEVTPAPAPQVFNPPPPPVVTPESQGALPNDVDPNFIPAPPNKQINTIISAELDPEIQYQEPVFTPAYPGALAKQTDGTLIDEFTDPVLARQVNAFETGLPPSEIVTEVQNFERGLPNGDPNSQSNAVESARNTDTGTTVSPDQTGESTQNVGGGVDVFENTIIDQTNVNTDGMIDLTAQQDVRGNQTFAGVTAARQQAVAMGSGAKDWRFKMSLSPSANYLYKASPPGILAPLLSTDGVIFPYSPQIGISYTSNYANYDLTHTNYKIFTYKNSSVESISITGDFTAQDTAEANYLLAVIHFFKSVTKMFYGQDQNPQRGVPPPLVYLTGFGQYQFDRHPVVVTNFTYNLPADVDYINAYPTNNSSAIGGQNMQPYAQQITKWLSPLDRIRQLASKIQPGGLPSAPTFTSSQNINEATRVPTKIQIQLQCLPIVTRNAISNGFSLKAYATGSLLRGSTNRLGGGIW